MDNKEFRIEAKIKNNLILRRIEMLGFRSPLHFCGRFKVDYGRLLDIIGFKRSVLRKDGKYISLIYKLCEIFKCLPEEIISEEQINLELKSNKRSLEIGAAEAQFYLSNQNDNNGFLDDIIEMEDVEQLNNNLDNALEKLPIRYRNLVKFRYGIEDGNFHTLEETATKLGVTRERIRQMEGKALAILRQPRNWGI